MRRGRKLRYWEGEREKGVRLDRKTGGKVVGKDGRG